MATKSSGERGTRASRATEVGNTEVTEKDSGNYNKHSMNSLISLEHTKSEQITFFTGEDSEKAEARHPTAILVALTLHSNSVWGEYWFREAQTKVV